MKSGHPHEATRIITPAAKNGHPQETTTTITNFSRILFWQRKGGGELIDCAPAAKDGHPHKATPNITPAAKEGKPQETTTTITNFLQILISQSTGGGDFNLMSSSIRRWKAAGDDN